MSGSCRLESGLASVMLNRSGLRCAFSLTVAADVSTTFFEAADHAGDRDDRAADRVDGRLGAADGSRQQQRTISRPLLDATGGGDDVSRPSIGRDGRLFGLGDQSD